MAENANGEQLSYEDCVKRALEADNTLLGKIWKHENEHGRVSAKVTGESVNPGKHFMSVYNYWPVIDAITKRKVPDKPSKADRIIQPLRGFVKR